MDDSDSGQESDSKEVKEGGKDTGKAKTIRLAAFHPLLFAIYPVLFYYSFNIAELPAPLQEILPPMVVCLLFALVLWGILRLIIKDGEKRALVLSLFLLFFFSFGQIANILSELGLKSEGIVNPSTVSLTLTIAGFALLTYLILVRIKNTAKFTLFANLMSVILIIFCLVAIARFMLFEMGFVNRFVKSSEDKGETAQSEAIGLKPSIYYIILDTYGGEDALKEYYNYDNSAFLNYLRQRGFQVVKDARSNYCTTITSLSSSLNMDYLDPSAGQDDMFTSGDARAVEMLRHNRVADFLKKRGYMIVTFSSGSPALNISKAENIAPYNWSELTEFQWLLVSMTPFQLFLNKKERIFTPVEVYRKRISRTLDMVADTAKIDKPVFVFAHVLAPHSPLVYVKTGVGSGGFTFSRDYYIQQLEFVNKKMEQVIDRMLSDLKRPAIIIIQGDHGPSSRNLDDPYFPERYSILNAIYMPDNSADFPGDSLTPVNTFRIILTKYFKADYKNLENRYYFSTTRKPAEFMDVGDKVYEKQDRK